MNKIVVFLSGRGSNFQAIVENVSHGLIPLEITAVISDKKNAAGLAIAKENGIETVHVPRLAKERSVAEFGQALVDAVRPFEPDLIVLAGFMRIVGPELIREYPMRILNIHPSLLPSFPGLGAPEQAIEAGVKFSGTTVHYVVEEVDAGPIIAQAIVPVLQGDNAEILEQRILQAEHRLYPAVISGIARDQIRFNNQTQRVEIDSELGPQLAVQSTASLSPIAG